MEMDEDANTEVHHLLDDDDELKLSVILQLDNLRCTTGTPQPSSSADFSVPDDDDVTTSADDDSTGSGNSEETGSGCCGDGDIVAGKGDIEFRDVDVVYAEDSSAESGSAGRRSSTTESLDDTTGAAAVDSGRVGLKEKEGSEHGKY